MRERGREEEWREREEEKKEKEKDRSNFSRKITQVWELLSVLCATYSIREGWFSDLIVQ